MYEGPHWIMCHERHAMDIRTMYGSIDYIAIQ